MWHNIAIIIILISSQYFTDVELKLDMLDNEFHVFSNFEFDINEILVDLEIRKVVIEFMNAFTVFSFKTGKKDVKECPVFHNTLVECEGPALG